MPNPDVEPNAGAAQGGEGQEPDYKALYEQLKAESRKWEDRSKQNKAKADKLDELMAGNSSIEERIAALEAENKAMKDVETRHALVAKVSAAVGLPEGLVGTLNGQDEETLTAQAKAVAALKPKGAPSVPEAGKFPREQQAEDADAEKRKFVRQLLGKE